MLVREAPCAPVAAAALAPRTDAMYASTKLVNPGASVTPDAIAASANPVTWAPDFAEVELIDAFADVELVDALAEVELDDVVEVELVNAFAEVELDDAIVEVELVDSICEVSVEDFWGLSPSPEPPHCGAGISQLLSPVTGDDALMPFAYTTFSPGSGYMGSTPSGEVQSLMPARLATYRLGSAHRSPPLWPSMSTTAQFM